MTWLFEDATSILLLGVLAEAILIAVLVYSGHRMILAAIACVLLLVTVLLAIEGWVKTEAEQIESVLQSIADALQENDSREVLRHVSASASRIRSEVENQLPQHEIREARIVGRPKVTLNQLTEPPSARATFFGQIAVKTKRNMNPYERIVRQFTLLLIREENQWRVSDYHQIQ